MSNRRAGAVLLAMLTSLAVHAVEVQTWTQRTASDFSAGELAGVVVTSQDRVQLGRQLSALAPLDVDHVWALARENDGSLLAATGGPGLLVRISPQGEVTTLHEAKDQQIFALSLAPDGTIYYGASPSGEVFRRTRDGEVDKFFATEETYIWGMALDGTSALLIATGPNGKLLRVNLDGQGGVHFQAKQRHLLSLAAGAPGVCYLGTSNDGLVYRVDADGKGFVLYDAPQPDVSAVILDSEGTLYAGTGTPERPNLPLSLRRTGERSLGWASFLWPGAATFSMGYLGPPPEPVADAPAPVPSKSPSSTAPIRPGQAAAGENSVYQIRPDGVVDEIFREKSLVLSLAMLEGNVLIGTGQAGRLFLVDPTTRERQTLAQLESGQIQAMVGQPDGSVVVGSGTPGGLWLVGTSFRNEGNFVSDVLDTKIQTRYGRGHWQGDAPNGTLLRIEYRCGNVAIPDATWSGWVADSTSLPLGRFLQYRAQLKSTDGKVSPSLSAVHVHYATVNRPPLIESLETPDLAKSPATSTDNKVQVRWKATDPNTDSMSFDVEVRKESWPEWVSIARSLTSSEFDWDPKSMPSGEYRIRVTASDERSNRQADALRTSRVSEPFVLDRDPPVTTIQSLKSRSRRLEVVASARDEQTRLTAAAYSLDGKEWMPLFPDDGLFDGLSETIHFQTDELPPGAYLVLVRFRDSAGQMSVADAVAHVDR